jgi:hypothetical protein
MAAARLGERDAAGGAVAPHDADGCVDAFALTLAAQSAPFQLRGQAGVWCAYRVEAGNLDTGGPASWYRELRRPRRIRGTHG